MAKTLTEKQVFERLRAAINRAGTQTKFADQNKINRSVLSDVMNLRREFPPALLKVLGLERITVWKEVDPLEHIHRR